MLADAHPDVREVLDRCEELREETDGYFDAYAANPDVLDPSGLVNGWALPEPVWRVGIEHPRERAKVAAVVSGDDLAGATSGAYARGEHVIDPHMRRPPEGVLSVTIVGPDLATADAYATAAFAMGVRAPHWTARLRGYEPLTLLADGRSLRAPGFPLTSAGAPTARPASRTAPRFAK